MKRFMARYIFYLVVFGYSAVSLVALAIAACFFFTVDDVLRHQGDPVAIKPRAEAIKRKADALVTRVFIQKHQTVRKGDPLLEVVEDPEWMSRYLIMRQMRTLLDEFAAPGQAEEIAKERIKQAQKEAREAALAQVKKAAGPTLTEAEEDEEEEKESLPVVPLTPEEEELRSLAAQRLADWEANAVPKAPRILIRAPIDGVVVSPDDLDFKKVDADAEILKVVDLNDLRLTVKVAGQTVADARTGQKAIIKMIFPDYKKGVVFHGDTVPEGRWFWQKQRVTSHGLLDPKIKETVKEAFKDQKITQRNDIPFKLTDVTDVDVNAEITTTPLEGGNSLAPRGYPPRRVRLPVPSSGTAQAAPAVRQPLAPSPMGARSQEPGAGGHRPKGGPEPGAPIIADAPAELELNGKVLEGKHLLTVQIATLPPSVTQAAMKEVASKLRGRLIEAPQEPEAKSGPIPVETLRIEDVRGVHLIAKVKGENADAKGRTKRLKREAARSAVRGASLERQYEATIQIQNPPSFLKERVMELLEQGKEVKAKAEVTTGRRRVALVLLKR